MKQTTTLDLTGMYCAACAGRIEKVLGGTPGVESAYVNFATERATVAHDETATSVERLIERVVDAGYGATPRVGAASRRGRSLDEDDARRQARHDDLVRRVVVSGALSVVVAILAMPLMSAAGPAGHDLLHRWMEPVDSFGRNIAPWLYRLPADGLRWASFLLTLPIVLWSGREIYRAAWNGARHRQADMNTLISVGTGAAFIQSLFATLGSGWYERYGLAPDVYWEAVAWIITLVLTGRLLESGARGRAAGAVRRLLDMTPPVAHVVREGREVDIEVEDVALGDRVVLRPGERVPVDGQITEGHSAIDESMLTGESLPVSKAPEAMVFAGTLNGHGSLQFIATRLGGDTFLGQIAGLVESAQGSRAPIQRLADRVASVFVPIVIVVAILTAVIWLLVGPEPRALYAMTAAVTVLIIACPCALGLATPTAIMVGAGRAAEFGILIRDASALEVAARLDTILMDKTGTLTEGRPRVTDVVALGSESELLALAAAAERRSEHPLARAIVAEAEARGFLDSLEVTSFEATPGGGVSARVDARELRLGTAAFLATQGIVIEADSLPSREAALLADQGRTTLFVAADGVLLGWIGLADTVKPNAAAVVSRLQSMGLHVAIVSGDSAAAAHFIARETGITDVRAPVLPADKAHVVRSFQSSGHRVAMVGDGINDAPALAAADVGIAIGTGADIAIEAADIALVRGDLVGVAEAILLSRRTLATVRQNLVWAFGYNVIGIPIAAGVLYPAFGLTLSPVLASLAMAISSVSVVLNSLRLRGARLTDGPPRHRMKTGRSDRI